MCSHKLAPMENIEIGVSALEAEDIVVELEVTIKRKKKNN